MIPAFCAVGRCERVELEWMLADRQFLVVRGPAIGRLILANWPPLCLSQVQTLGSTYPFAASVIAVPFSAQPIKRARERVPALSSVRLVTSLR